VEQLQSYHGPWTGTNRFRLRPNDEPYAAPMTAHLESGAGNTLTLLRYTWTHAESGPQDGLMLLGSGESPGEVVALWGDSWHQAPAARRMNGTAEPSLVTVAAEYGEGWEWRIVIDVVDPEVLHLRMDNVVPASATGGDEPLVYWAMDAQLRRR
jgi:hypothetical protein